MATIGRGTEEDGEAAAPAEAIVPEPAAANGWPGAVAADVGAVVGPDDVDDPEVCLKGVEQHVASGVAGAREERRGLPRICLLFSVCALLFGVFYLGPYQKGAGLAIFGGRAAPTAAPATALAQTPVSYSFLYSDEGLALLDEFIRDSRRSGGPKQALLKAEQLMSSNRHFMDSCHPLLHRFGRTLYREGGTKALAAAFAQLVDFGEDALLEADGLLSKTGHVAENSSGAGGAPHMSILSDDALRLFMVCNGAYLHGVIELYLFKVGLVGNLKAGADFVQDRICTRMEHGFRPPWECRHGIGHGIVQFSRRMRVLEALKVSLDLAAATRVPKAKVSDIWNGIWMDHFASAEFAAHDADDPGMAIGACYYEGAAGRGLGDCLMYSPTAFLLHRPRAYVPAHRWCKDGCLELKSSSSGQKRCQSSCTLGVGMQTMKENMDNASILGDVCKQAETQALAKSCISGASGYYFFAMGTQIPEALCTQISDSTLRKSCSRR